MADRTELTGLTLELDHKYSIGPAVQRGPMATMYRATWTLFELPVYVRFYESLIALRLAHRDATRIRWAIEGEAGRVRGEHLPDAIDTGIHGAQQPFLVVRIPRGETLQDRLSAQGPLPLEDAVELTRAMASALRDCRDQAQPHRGPTMDRVWCGEDGSYTLLGYGEVLYRDETLRIRGRSCTELLWHIPPESFRATQSEAGEPTTRSQSLRMSARNPAGHADRRIEESESAEVYALAALTYTALNGHHPFFTSMSDWNEGVQNTQTLQPLPVTGANAGVSAAIMRGLSRDPLARFPNVEAYVDALDAALTRDQEPALPSFEALSPEDTLAFEDDALDLMGPRDTTQLWLWRAATVLFALVAAGAIMTQRAGTSAVLVTSTPTGLELGRVNGHVSERLGATPITLVDVDPGRPLELFAIGPDGQTGAVGSYNLSNADLVGECRILSLDMQFGDDSSAAAQAAPVDETATDDEAAAAPNAAEGEGSAEAP